MIEEPDGFVSPPPATTAMLDQTVAAWSEDFLTAARAEGFTVDLADPMLQWLLTYLVTDLHACLASAEESGDSMATGLVEWTVVVSAAAGSLLKWGWVPEGDHDG